MFPQLRIWVISWVYLYGGTLTSLRIWDVSLGAINLIYFDANNVGNQSIDDGRLISGDSTNCVTSIIDEIGFRQAKVFPNTMSGILNFENFNDKVVEIYSNQRRLVRIENVENRQLDLRELKSGMYYIKEWRLF